MPHFTRLFVKSQVAAPRVSCLAIVPVVRLIAPAIFPVALFPSTLSISGPCATRRRNLISVNCPRLFESVGNKSLLAADTALSFDSPGRSWTCDRWTTHQVRWRFLMRFCRRVGRASVLLGVVWSLTGSTAVTRAVRYWKSRRRLVNNSCSTMFWISFAKMSQNQIKNHFINSIYFVNTIHIYYIK